MTAFLHLTDLHFSANVPGAADKRTVMARLAADCAAMRVKPEFVILSGDLTDTGDAASYDALRPLIAEFPVPVLLALGNHDRRAAFHAAFDTGGGDTPYCHAAVVAGVHILTLDTLVPARVAGALDAGQLDWLAGELDRHAGLPKLIVAHHPPRLDPMALPWTCLDAGSTEKLGAVIAGRGVAGILSGHIHMNRVSLWQGVPVVTNIGLHSTIDLMHHDGLRLVEGTGFGLCRLGAGGSGGGGSGGGGLSVAFAQITPMGREIGLIDAARLRAFA